MERSLRNYYPSKKNQGLTLIEVLIALAIVGIAMTAVIKASSQNIRHTTYLQNKTMALWVGQQIINEARVGLVIIPNPPDKLRQTTTMFNQKWRVILDQEASSNSKIRKIVAKVYPVIKEEDIEDDAASPLITLESYLYHEEK